MRKILLILLIVNNSLVLWGNLPEIRGKLSTGEQLTGYYSPGVFTFGNNYVWETADDPEGIQGVKEVGKTQNYLIKQGDAGRYIRLEVTTYNLFGRKTTVYSTWQGPIRNSVPLIQGTVTISGTLKAGHTAYANYVYSPDNYVESGSTFKWYRANDPAGSGAFPVTGNSSSLPLEAILEDKYIRVEVIPADINGTEGLAYTSSWYGPVQKEEVINNPPMATNVRIRGNPVYCGVLTGLYDYSDSENDTEGGSTYRWLRAPGAFDVPVPIPGATSNTYTITTSDKGMFLYFEVTPKAVSGNTTGIKVLSNSTSQVLGDLPSVIFSGSATICEGTSTFISLTFIGNPPFNLEYTNGVKTKNLTTSNYNYQLEVNTGGTYKGTKLTDALNCPVTNLPSSAVITPKAKPDLGFSVENTCYNGDSTVFRNESNAKNTIIRWSWNFGDTSAPQNQNTSSQASPKHKYQAPGDYSVWLAAENNEGCRDTTIKKISLGEKPDIDFSWNKECFSTNMHVTFKGVKIGTAPISEYSWLLKNDEKLLKEASGKDFSHSFSSRGKYEVKLKVTTDLGCRDSISKWFVPKPVIKLQSSMYADDFEGSTDWSAETDSKNNWQKGKPPGTLQPHSGTNAFYTSLAGEKQDQLLILSSPCFDFTGLEAPFLEMWVNYNHEKSKEGAVIQHKQDGSDSWATFGTLNSGFNWYNNDSISSSPGNSSVGWSGNSDGWKPARHSINMNNKTNILFRIVYRSASGAKSGDGFAVDDVFVGQRGKKVLVEYFTNLSDKFATQSNLTFDSIVEKSGANTIPVRYHTAFPGTDSLNEDNKANPSARALYYGVARVPVSILDGGSIENHAYDFTSKKMNSNDLQNRSFEDPKFKIEITSGILNNTVNGVVKITALNNLSGTTNTLNIAIVEDVAVTIDGKQVTLKNVVKYMYPSAGGSLLASSWVKNQSLEIPFSWTMNNVYNKLKTKVIAFIQNNNTKEIYQSELASNTAITSAGVHEKKFSPRIYPNPASDNLWIEFGKTTEPLVVHIINPAGKLAAEYLIEGGANKTNISLNHLPNGVYFVKTIQAGKLLATEKLIVSRP